MLLLCFALLSIDATTAELESLYRQNALQAQTLRVQWKRTSTETPNMRRVYEGMLEQHEKIAADPTSSATDRAEAKGSADSMKRFLAKKPGLRTETVQQDFWTDRVHFQMRFPVSTKMGGAATDATAAWVALPDHEATADSLSKDFSAVTITSWGPATNRVFRRWDGRPIKAGTFSGLIGTAHPEPDLAHYPPLAIPSADWGGEASPLDGFFEPQPTRERIIGAVDIDGISTIAWERAWKRGAIWTVMVGYVDPNRAGIPLRLEIYGAAELPLAEQLSVPWEDRHVKRGVYFPIRRVKTNQIADRDGIAYPTKGTVEHFQPLSPDNGAEVVVVRQEEWDVRSVERDRPMSEEMFALKFPANTVFVDQTRNETRLTGDVDGHADRVIGGLRPDPRQATWWLNRWVWIVPIGVIVLFVGVRSWRRNR